MQKDAIKSHSSTFSHRLFADQVHKQYENTVLGSAATLINGTILVFILRAHVQHMTLIIWLACAGIVSACRLMLYWAYRKSQTQNSNPKKWNVWFITTLFLSGVLWGSVAVFLFPSDSIGHQAFIAFVTGGMVAGAVGAFTAVIAAFFMFSIPALLPICVRFFLLGGDMHLAMGAMVFLFLLLISLTAVRMHKDIIHLMLLKYERSALVADLQQEVDQRKAAEENLRQQKEQVEEFVTQRTAQLKNANQRLQAILSYAPLLIWAIDKEGILTFCEGKGLEKIGFAPGESVGKSVFELFAKDGPIIDITQRVLAGEFVSDTIQFKDVFFEVRYQPLVNAGDYLAGAIGVAIDVTEKIAAEDALRKSEEKYRELVKNINDTLYAVDREGRITYISPVIESVLGYRATELIGKSFFDYIYHRDQARLRSDFAGAKDVISSPREYRFLDKTGGTKWCRVSSRIISEGGKKIGIQGVLVDITQSKRLEEQLQRAQKMEALGTLAGGVAHDLNNILSGIVSYPELLLMDLPQDSSLRQPLTTIKKSGENAAAVVQDLLTLARRGVTARELLNLNKIVEECLHSPEIRSLRSLHPNIDISIRLQSDLFNIYGSFIHIFKSLSNLISNAVEAMPQGGRIKIATNNRYTDGVVSGFDTVEEGEYAVLSIADSGIGISESDKARIFEPFYTKKVIGRSGSGLGMAVVWGTVKDHNGYIDVQSQKGQGTRYELFFPATRDHLKKDEDPKELSDVAGNGEFILVVDDIPAQREIATSILDRLGYRSQAVASGEEAVEFVRQHTVDLVILDMIMEPGIDGYETYRQIRDIRPAQKAIIASGYSETERVRKTQDSGAGRYIKKPYTLAAIGSVIKEELQSKEKRAKS
jgi:PAS domain S-box-containing protein